MDRIPVTVAGILGQMGRRLMLGISGHPALKLSGGTLRSGHPGLGQDLGVLSGIGLLGIAATDNLAKALESAKVLIDFTSPAALKAHLAAAQKVGCAAVIGTTALGDREKAALKEASAVIPVLWAPNMSLGVNLLYKLVSEAAKSLGPDFDVEIVEAHHHRKKDAPSGTAVRLFEVIAEAKELDKKEALITGRNGLVGARPTGEIGVLALRGGDIVGEHTVYFCGQGERLELTHRAQSRDTFAAGAMRAAVWLAGKSKGLYSINDVLGLK
ncbi:MAG: 4-hydroxy-tetrahydrodipicolinate reductase [Deltaproteobacteria bacterium]|jgi:4-hydroxy-tetrahydrodipicolinate reductase|nr:4-hydroxy-tetrahydrodipicolinate reductase [Deltaproteobacteria bacterium]